jgi:diacylglycerol kinase
MVPGFSGPEQPPTPLDNPKFAVMIKFFRSRAKAIGFAIEGWEYVIRTQRNTWIHALASVVVVLMGFWLQLSLQDWAILLIMIALVWIVEFINTAVEALTDLVSPERNHLAKTSKDVSAAAVLIAAATSIIIGLLILGPPLLRKICSLTMWF